MKIALVSNGDIPPFKYGGTQRVVAWLAKGLLNLGHKVYIICDGQCTIQHKNLKVIKLNKEINRMRKKDRVKEEVYSYIPSEVDLVHLHFNPKEEPSFPYLITFHWLGKAQSDFSGTIKPNTIFASEKHAALNGRTQYVHHGLDPDEFVYKHKKSSRFLFLSKVSYSPKNVKTAIRLAKKLKFKLDIAGGWRLNFSRYLKYHGMVGGQNKKRLLSDSKALIFPTLIEEPFGLVTIEALASGTPVISSENGAMPEIITSDVGFRCSNFNEYIAAIRKIDEIDSVKCRERVLNKFTHIHMARGYLNYYQQVLEKGSID